MSEFGPTDRRVVLERNFRLACEAWQDVPPKDLLYDNQTWDCEVCERQFNWGVMSTYRNPEGLHRCVAGCAVEWHFICVPCLAQEKLEREDGSLGLPDTRLATRLGTCPDSLKVAESLMDPLKIECERCQDTGSLHVGSGTFSPCPDCLREKRLDIQMERGKFKSWSPKNPQAPKRKKMRTRKMT